MRNEDTLVKASLEAMQKSGGGEKALELARKVLLHYPDTEAARKAQEIVETIASTQLDQETSEIKAVDDDLIPEGGTKNAGGLGKVFVGVLMILAGIALGASFADQSGQNPLVVLVLFVIVLPLVGLGIRFILVGLAQFLIINVLGRMKSVGQAVVVLCGLALFAWASGDWGTGRGEAANSAANAVRFVWTLPSSEYVCGNSYTSLVANGQTEKLAYIELRNMAARAGAKLVSVKKRGQNHWGVFIIAAGCNDRT